MFDVRCSVVFCLPTSDFCLLRPSCPAHTQQGPWEAPGGVQIFHEWWGSHGHIHAILGPPRGLKRCAHMCLYVNICLHGMKSSLVHPIQDVHFPGPGVPHGAQVSQPMSGPDFCFPASAFVPTIQSERNNIDTGNRGQRGRLMHNQLV